MLCVNTIRTLSIDAVQQAQSGHPGTPMALAPMAFERRRGGPPSSSSIATSAMARPTSRTPPRTEGRMVGMNTFGASAPLKELDRRFGFEPDRVAAIAREVLGTRRCHWSSMEGSPAPLGVRWVPSERAFNFALCSRHASEVALLLCDVRGQILERRRCTSTGSASTSPPSSRAGWTARSTRTTPPSSRTSPPIRR